MKQRIVVSAIMGSGGDKLKIHSVNETQDKLIVIANFIESQSLFAPASITEIKDEVLVNTSSKTVLPVTYYLTGLSKEDFDMCFENSPYRSHQPYLSHLHTPTEFVYLASKEKMNGLLSESKSLYPCAPQEMLSATNSGLFFNNRADATGDRNQSCQTIELKNICTLS